jgi:hypothetical protein
MTAALSSIAGPPVRMRIEAAFYYFVAMIARPHQPRWPLTGEQRKHAARVGRERMDLNDSHGLDQVEWHALRRQMRLLLRKRARERGRYTDGDLIRGAHAEGLPELDPHSPDMASMLGQINILEMERGLPMLTAIVVHKHGPSVPGVGYWNLAEMMGIDVGTTEESVDAFWVSELQECYRVWPHKDIHSEL